MPFKEGNQFAQDDSGFQHALYSIRDRTRTIATIHTELAHTIESTVLAPLSALAKELGEHNKEIDADLGKTANDAEAEVSLIHSNRSNVLLLTV